MPIRYLHPLSSRCHINYPDPAGERKGDGGETLDGVSHSVFWEMDSWDSFKGFCLLMLFTGKKMPEDPAARISGPLVDEASGPDHGV